MDELRKNVEKIAAKINMKKVVDNVVAQLDGDEDASDKCYIRAAVALYVLECLINMTRRTDGRTRVRVGLYSATFGFGRFDISMGNYFDGNLNCSVGKKLSRHLTDSPTSEETNDGK